MTELSSNFEFFNRVKLELDSVSTRLGSVILLPSSQITHTLTNFMDSGVNNQINPSIILKRLELMINKKQIQNRIYSSLLKKEERNVCRDSDPFLGVHALKHERNI